jgi:uncharacterized protein YvpB
MQSVCIQRAHRYFPYDCLHILVVIGYDDAGNILANDPNFGAEIISIKESEFIKAWMEIDGLVILIEKASQIC